MATGPLWSRSTTRALRPAQGLSNRSEGHEGLAGLRIAEQEVDLAGVEETDPIGPCQHVGSRRVGQAAVEHRSDVAVHRLLGLRSRVRTPGFGPGTAQAGRQCHLPRSRVRDRSGTPDERPPEGAGVDLHHQPAS